MTHVLVTGSANCSACSPPRLIDDRGLPATTWSAPTVQGHPCYVDLIVVESASVVLTAGTDAEPLYEYGPGSVIGELVLLTGHGVQFSAQATQPGVVHRVTPMSLRNLLLEERELSELLLTAFMARRRRGRNDRGGRVTLEIAGTPQSPATQALRTYANRTGIKHTWLDADGPSGRSLMSAAGLVGADLPAVVGPRETVINATPADLVTIRDGTPRAGVVDVVVVGAGPAGLAAAMGCALAGMSTVTLDREGPGGHAAQATRLEHYLGYLTGVTGTELMSPGARPGSGGRARLVSPCAVLSLTPSTDASTLSLADGSELSARAVIVASGATYPTADRPGWQEFGGRGVYYAVTESAARMFVGKPVIVVGDSGDAANERSARAGR